MILSIILVGVGVVLLDLVAIFAIQGFSFKDFFKKLKDVSYWQQKANTYENELEIQRIAHAKNTIAWTKQIEEITASVINKQTKNQIANNEIKKLRERIRALESNK